MKITIRTKRNYYQCKKIHLAGTPNTLYSKRSGRGTAQLYTGHKKISFLLLTLFIEDQLHPLSLLELPTVLSEICHWGKLEATYHSFPSSARCPCMSTAFWNHCDQSETEFVNVGNNRLAKGEKAQNGKIKMFKDSPIWRPSPAPFQCCDFSIYNCKENVSCLATVHRDNISLIFLWDLNRGTLYTSLWLLATWVTLSKDDPLQQDCVSKAKWVHHMLRGILPMWFGGYGRKLADAAPGHWHFLRCLCAAKQN